MGWLDCLKPASFDECNLKGIFDYYGSGIDIVLGNGSNPPPEGTPNKEGLLGLENELRFASLVILGAIAYRVIK